MISKEKSWKQTLIVLVSIALQNAVPIYKGIVNYTTNSFKTQVAILDNECGLQFPGNNNILKVGNSFS